ncbi:type 2 periplasmic-binding domain-containing protein [Pseudoalteromonas aurantia]|uniref:Solute-binding protein family 3/N-terminal domain-containing protein n=1 Tax=Pseudoalteromonas aurantia 208 TaxID=1314867 RepID=A0ABR9E842_9GAMM|nr:hypothetical protein [Pseudoalteromonas aurantia]MBE0367165.1 hypothetical protein [Pseudoalteromonas aurantia 208]
MPVIYTLCFLLFSSFAYSNNTLIFNRPADTPQSRYVIELTRLVYKNIGYDIKIIDFNYQSALVAANAGVLDGQLGRVDGASQQYPSLIKVDFPLLSFNLQFLSHCQTCSILDAQSIVIQASHLAPKAYLGKQNYLGELIQVKSNSTQLNLLTQKKVSAALVIGFHIKEYKEKLQKLGIFSTTLDKINLYHYLHEKHAHLVPRIMTSLIDLDKKGTVSMLKNKYGI